MRNRILSLLFLLPFISESVSAALVEEIYGTAHNSVVRKPGTDEWYIVYHRINKITWTKIKVLVYTAKFVSTEWNLMRTARFSG